MGGRGAADGWVHRFPGAVLTLSPEGAVLASNGRLEQRFEVAVVGRNLAELLDPSSQQRWSAVLASIAPGGSPEGAACELILSAGGQLALLSFHAVPCGDHPLDDEPCWWLVEHVRDPAADPLHDELAALNSELVNTQRELAKERARLDRALATSVAARARADAAVHVRDEVLAIVSHDLRNPLTTIFMSARALSRRISDADAQRPVELIRREAERMTRLIGDLLEVTRLETAQLFFELSTLPVDGVLTELVDVFEAQRAEGEAPVVLGEVPSGGTVYADRERLVQVLGNLVGNARRLTPAGGVITVSAAIDDDWMTFSVTDTGPGIPAADQPHLFDRFWQARKSRRGGAGLGLAISKGIVEAHGGEIWVMSQEGHGARFVFTMPRNAEVAEAAQSAASATAIEPLRRA